MKRIYLLIAVVAILSSCAEVYFVEPQPAGMENLTEIPPQLRGEYVMPATINKENKISIEKYRIKSNDGSGGVLSDSLIIRQTEDYLVVNKLEKSKKKPQIQGNWSVVLIKKNVVGNIEVTPFTVAGEDKEKYYNYLDKNFKCKPITQISSWDYVEETNMEAPELAPKDYKAILLELTKKDFYNLIRSDYLPSPIILKNIKNN